MTNQARNLAMALQDEGRTVKFLIHDRDSKFSSPFDEVLRGGGTRIILTPIRAPNANAVCERWVGNREGRVLGLDARPRPEGTWSASFGSRSAIQGGQARIEGSRFKRR